MRAADRRDLLVRDGRIDVETLGDLERLDLWQPGLPERQIRGPHDDDEATAPAAVRAPIVVRIGVGRLQFQRARRGVRLSEYITYTVASIDSASNTACDPTAAIVTMSPELRAVAKTRSW